jgi:UvrD-like helicase C-terminal domain/AAA domain
MEFRIADTFTDALARLPAQDQKAVKTSAFDLQMDPSAPGLQMHRIDKSKDPNFWSVRVSRDVRIIVHKTAASLLLAYVDHHDKAYAWAERRRIEAHPRTGVVQIVEVRERVEEVVAPTLGGVAKGPMFAKRALAATPIFHRLTRDQLLSVGVPEDWLADVAAATEDSFFDLAAHLPAEAAEALLEYAATGLLKAPEPVAAEAAFGAPDALRRFRIVENLEELQQALDAPWDRWSVFLHPSQRAMVERTFSGPARVAGSAGTGKTVVALHRAARLGEAGPDARVLLTTFSEPLALSLKRKLAILLGPRTDVVPRITVAPWRATAGELFELAFGRRPQIAGDELVRSTLQRAADEQGLADVSTRFLVAEWTHVVDAWQIASLEAYATVPRLGRRNRMGARQRERLWPVFAAARRALSSKGLSTWPMVFSALADHDALKATKPFGHVVVDEAQDLGVAELRFLAAITPEGPDGLFFAGDLGQRIFQQPFSWLALGVDVRGRSQVLKVNYRTSHQIRQSADRLLSTVVRDADGLAEDRTGTVSVFDGPLPEIKIVADEEGEIAAVADFLRCAIAAGTAPHEIGVFVRSDAQLPRARGAAKEAGVGVLELSEQAADPGERISIGLMHLAKGLEFKAVAVMACDQEVLPLQERIETVTDEVELEDVYETERQLFYVACTRARDRLMVSGVAPGSEFMADLREHARAS